jgi:hypothetical protein
MNHALVMTPTVTNHYLLVKDFKYKSITVPKGYETNGADIPRVFWWFVPPFKPKYLPAVVIHDYLCDLKEYGLADNVFEEMLLEIENSFTTRTMVRVVRFYTRWLR